MSWRDRARPIISRVLSETRGKPEAERKQALRNAYPFIERRYHPYRIWLNEIAVQTGRNTARPHAGREDPKPDPRQLDIFEDTQIPLASDDRKGV